MTNAITKQERCVLLRGETRLWIEEERVQQLEEALKNPNNRFLKINGQLVNTFEIIGVFTPKMIENRVRYKNGQWECEQGKWHERGQQCQCIEYKETVTAYVDGIGEVTYKR